MSFGALADPWEHLSAAKVQEDRSLLFVLESIIFIMQIFIVTFAYPWDLLPESVKSAETDKR